MPLALTIFHTNDMHGRLEAMARLSTFVRRLRAEAAAAGRYVLVWDAGDAADRRVRLCSATKGAAFAPILNAMGYSLQTMGNAIALTYGPQAMAAVAERSAFPILAANCRNHDGPLPPGLLEYAVVPVPAGRALGVIGLTASFPGLYEMFGLHFPDAAAVTRRLVAVLRERGTAPIVVLSHLGLPEDRQLAEDVPGIDLIIGAHSHDRLPAGELVNGVLIAQAGQYAEGLGRVDLTVGRATGKVLERNAVVFDVPADVEPDPAVLDAIRAGEAEADAILAAPVGDLAAPLDLDYFAECALGNLAADAMRERMGGDCAIVASGQFHLGLPAGRLTLGALQAACFSTANPALTQLSGAQLRAGLERGLDAAVANTYHRGLRGTPVGLPQVSGLAITYEAQAPVGQRVREVRVAGKPLKPDTAYRVAHTDFEIYRGAGYLDVPDDCPTRYEMPTILGEVLADYVRAHSPVPLPSAGRWAAR